MNLGKLKSVSKGLFQHESSAAVEKPWAGPPSPLLNGAVRVLGARAGRKTYPSLFPNKVRMGEFPTGTLVGFVALFFSPSAPHKNIVQLETP